MSWMIFFQQSAVVAKRLRSDHLRASQWDTAVGSVVTQLVVAPVLVTTAATSRSQHGAESLSAGGQIAHALISLYGAGSGAALFWKGDSWRSVSRDYCDLPGRGMGDWRVDRLQTLSREPPQRSPLDLRSLCVSGSRLSRARGLQTKLHCVEFRHRGYERASSGADTWISGVACCPRVTGGAPPAGSPIMGGGRDLRDHKRSGNLVCPKLDELVRFYLRSIA